MRQTAKQTSDAPDEVKPWAVDKYSVPLPRRQDRFPIRFTCPSVQLSDLCHSLYSVRAVIL